MSNYMDAELIPGLTNDLALLCLAKLPYTFWESGRRVCKSWCMALSSECLHNLRKKSGWCRDLICFCHGVSEVNSQPAILLSLFDLRNWSCLRLPPLYLSRMYGLGKEANDPASVPVLNFKEYEVVVVKSTVFIIGGMFFLPGLLREGNKRIWGFDGVTFSWRHYFNAPIAMQRFSAVAVEDKVFMTGSFFHASTHILDVETGEFTPAAELPEAEQSTFFPSTGILFDNQIYVVPQEPPLFGNRHAFLYDMDHDRWTKMDGFWPRSGSLNGCKAMGVLRGELYGIKGGKNFAQDCISTRVITWNRDGSWLEVARLPSPEFSNENVPNTCHHFMLVVDGKLHIIEIVNRSIHPGYSPAYLHVINVIEKGPRKIARLELFNKLISNRAVKSCTVISI